MALFSALSPMGWKLSRTPILAKSVVMICPVRTPSGPLSGDSSTVYDIGWPSAIRMPFGPILYPAWLSSALAFDRLYGRGLTAGSYHLPVAGGTSELPAWA